MEIIRGLQPGPQRVVLYGPEGIGKSTFGSKFPRPVFIDTEGSTRHLDVARVVPKNWTEVKQAVIDLAADSQGFQTCVLDTADWAQRMAIDEVCAVRGILSIEAPGYGKGYTYLAEEWGRFLNSLTRLCESGMNVVLLAHAATRRFDLPEETGSYDRWELKLEKKLIPLTKEWADAVFFAQYKVYIVTDPDTKSRKAHGGQRVIYTTHNPCYDAKNRHGLPDEVPLDYAAVAHCFSLDGPPLVAQKPIESAPVPSAVAAERHPELRKRLTKAAIFDGELLELIAEKGYFPANTPIDNLPEDFVSEWVLKNWEKIVSKIHAKQEKEES